MPPIQPPLTTGTITANAQAVSASVAAAPAAQISVHGTYAAVTLTFEGSDDGGTTWYGLQAVRAVDATLEATSGALTNTSRLWYVPAGALTHVRARATAYTSGTASIGIAPVYDVDALLEAVAGGSGGAATIADGADVAEGATIDAAVTTNTTGSLSGKLRGLVAILADVWDSTNHRLKHTLYATATNPGDTPIDALTGNADGTSNTANTLRVTARGQVFNGTTWDRQRGDTNGAYVRGAAPAATTGTLTAAQATLGTPVAGGTVLAAVGGYPEVTITVSGTYGAGTSVVVDVSDDGGTTWYPDYFHVEVDAGNVSSAVLSAKGLAANGLYWFLVPTSNATHVRLRASVFGSGSVPVRITPGAMTQHVPFPTLVGSSSLPVQQGTDADGIGSANAYLGTYAWSVLWNGASHDRQRNNLDATLLASAARTVTTNSADQVNYNGRSLLLVVDVSVPGTGSITPAIQIKDSISGNYVTIWTAAAAITTQVTNTYLFADGASSGSFTEKLAFGLHARTWRLVMTANNANSATYSASGVVGV